MARGTFIVIDGVDGSGKATQTKLFVDRARREGRDVETISFPRYDTPAGKMVRAYLNGEFGTPEEFGPYRASWLYAADRLCARATIRDWLNAGKLVIADRYVASNMGHQGGKIRDAAARATFLKWVVDQEYGILDLPRPDLNVILHVPAEVSQRMAMGRGVPLDAHEADLAHLKNAETTYVEIAGAFPGFTLIECMRDEDLLPVDEVHALAWGAVANLLPSLIRA